MYKTIIYHISLQINGQISTQLTKHNNKYCKDILVIQLLCINLAYCLINLKYLKL